MADSVQSSVVIEPIEERYIEPAARLLAESMAEPMKVVFGDSSSASMLAFRISQMQRAKAAQEHSAHPPTRIVVAREASPSATSARDGLLGLAVWEIINEAPNSTSEGEKKEVELPELAPFSETTNVGLFKRLWEECEKAMDEITRGRGTIHLKYLVIAEAAQRRGVGKALMARVKADARAVPAGQATRLIFLDAAPTQSAVPFYTGQGFKLIQECTAAEIEGSPTLYEMLWEDDH